MRPSASAAAGALALLLLPGCNLDLTGATCNTNDNCPVRQYCAIPSGARRGSCQVGERVNATLALTADSPILPAGGSTQAVATLTSEGGPPVPDGGLVTDMVEWTVDPDSQGIISVDNDAGTRGLVEALKPGQGLLLGTISFSGQLVRGSTTIVVSNAALTRLVVVADRPRYAAGTAGSATAIGFFSDGSHADLTSLVKWSSSTPQVLTVSGASGSWGRLSAVAPGATTLQAVYLDLTGSTTVTVTGATLAGLSISPLQPRGVEGIDLALEATGSFSDGSAQSMTRSVQWSVDDQSVGYFSSPGVVTLLQPGSTTLRALASNIEAQAGLHVGPVDPAQLEISPAWPDPLPLGTSTRLSAWTTHQDGTVCAATPRWSTPGPPLEVSSAGEVTASGDPGVGTVTASDVGLDAAARLDAVPADVAGWQVWPPELVVPVGAEGALAAERLLGSSGAQDLTDTVGWRPQDPDAGSIDVDTGERGGTVRPRVPGARVPVLAVAPGGQARAFVRAPAGTPTLEIVPPGTTLPVGGRTRLAAIGHWPDGTVIDLTAATSWSATPDGVVLPGDGPSAGLVLGADAGVSTLRARFGTASAQVQLQSESNPGTLEVWPAGATLAAGTALPLAVTLVTGSGDSVDVTLDAVWTSTNPEVAIATNAPGQRGVLLGRAGGSATLIARVDGLQAQLPVVVTNTTLQALQLQPAPTVVSWAPARFSATATFVDGTAQDATGLVTWTSSNRALLRIRGTGAERGTARGVDAGTVLVFAHPPGAGTATAQVAVNGSPPDSLLVQVPDGGVAVGTRPRAQAIALTADGATVDVTELAEWSSSDPGLATVSSVVRPGWVSARGAGTVTLEARFDGLTASAPLVIVPDALTALQLSAPGSLTVGETATARATAALFGNATQLMGEEVVWSSDNPGLLAVSNAPGARGRLLALAPGSATIRARTRSGLPALQASAQIAIAAPPGLRAVRTVPSRK